MLYFVDDSFNAFQTFVALYKKHATRRVRVRYVRHFFEIVKLRLKKGDVVILDFIFGKYDNSSSIFKLLEETGIPVILYSGNSKEEIEAELKRPLPTTFKYIQKSFDTEIYDYVNRVL